MINRHSSRIKTMQALYSYERSEGALRSTIEKYLSKSVFAVKDQYLYLLLLAREACNLVEVYADIKATKYLPSEKDKNFSTKLLSNTLIQYLNHDNEFQKAIEKSHLQHFLDETILKSIYQKLIKSDIYNLYLNNNKDFDFEEDRKIMYFLFDEIILKDEITLEHFEDVFATWEDDAYYVVQAVREVIKKSKTELKLHIEKDTLIEKFKELDEFSVALFNKTINNKKDQLEIVKPYLQNWDIDRIANVDFFASKNGSDRIIRISFDTL
jgi:N utilization substance protein B